MYERITCMFMLLVLKAYGFDTLRKLEKERVHVSVRVHANLSMQARLAVSSSVLAEVERREADCLGSAVLLLFI